jgi:hypothetical protein
MYMCDLDCNLYKVWKLKVDIINMNDKCFELMIFFYILNLKVYSKYKSRVTYFTPLMENKYILIIKNCFTILIDIVSVWSIFT